MLLLGMGGSSLCPEVMAQTFGPVTGLPRAPGPRLHRPGADRRRSSGASTSAQTLFIVSEQVREHARAEHLHAYFFWAKRGERSARRRPGSASWPSPIPARTCRR